MTTIAANRTMMAADSFVTDGNRTVKMLKKHGIIVGYAGDFFYANALAAWVLGGREGPLPPAPDEKWSDEADKPGDTALLILRKTGLSLMDGRGTEVALDGDYAAIGTGAEIALGALWAGKTPAEAVEAAATHDSNTKLPVHTLHLGRKK